MIDWGAIRESMGADKKLETLVKIVKSRNMTDISEYIENLTDEEKTWILKKIVYGEWKRFSGK